MSPGIERFSTRFIMDLHVFTGLNHYIVISRRMEKCSRLRKARQCRVESGLFFHLSFEGMSLCSPAASGWGRNRKNFSVNWIGVFLDM